MLVFSFAALGTFAAAATAEPVRLSRGQMDQVVAGAHTSTTNTTSTQGNGGQTNTSANPNNQGQTTTTTTSSGPPGQISQGNTGCNNCTTTTTTSGPGRSK